MSFFDLFDLDPHRVVDFLAKLGINVSEGTVDTVITFLILLAIIWAIGGSAVWIWKKGDAILTFLSRTRKWRKEYIKNGLEHSYGDYLAPERQHCYVPTQCQGTPPHNFDEPDEAVASAPKQELVKFFIDEVFTKDNTNRRLYCIFAGSGMGKTTFSVQLFVEYIHRYKESTLPYDIYLRDLGDAKVIEQIKSLSDEIGDKAHRSILILDALDENLQASEDFEAFRTKLEEVIAPFKFVVITCRSQFFPNEHEMPEYSNIRINTTDKNLLSYNKIYICPFSPSDITLYISKKYKGWGSKNRQLRKQAIAIIEKCKHLMARPVLLSYIDDLIDENRNYTTESDIYETLIKRWLKREVGNIPDTAVRMDRYNELVAFSQKLAERMYQNWRETGDFRLDGQTMNDFCQKNHFDKIHYQFRRRSLINHDAAGAFKFSHKSFLEYFLAQHYFKNPDFDFSFEGMDMAELFYKGFCKREYREKMNEKIFKIEEIRSEKYRIPYEELTLVIARKSDFDYTHLFYVIEQEGFSALELNWKAYAANVQQFIEASGIHTITIENYKKGTTGLRQILKSSDLEFVSIEGEELPKTFIKDAEKKGVHVIHNKQTIIRGKNPTLNSTLRIQLQLQMEKQLELIQRERLVLGRDMLNELLNRAIKEKGEEL